MLVLAICLVGTALFLSCSYWLSLRHIHFNSTRVMGWIEAALAGHGHVVGMCWLAASRFKVPLRLPSGVFHRAWMTVDLSASELPFRWLWRRVTRGQNLITFQADLDWPPPFSLDVHNFNWFARSSRKDPAATENWGLEQTGPFIITTRMEWPKEITSAMTSLAGAGQRQFLSISFSRRSPHFSVTMPLEVISPASPTRACIFESVRELAASSLPSLY